MPRANALQQPKWSSALGIISDGWFEPIESVGSRTAVYNEGNKGPQLRESTAPWPLKTR